ncbi:class I SAM-dependent methyltransferase [Nonomuraea sp. NPDC050536]|uniref:class I SAM-dependent methyltransferase n=1 Tax=Nonomuraea sp. NPDC050536 TaxID=3364366 RepID=UPI0037C9448E
MGSGAVQGELWGRAPGAWARWQEAQSRPLYEAVLDALEPLDGMELLDVGCGAGLALAIAAERGARTSGVDASEGLLEQARVAAPGAELREGDLESLPFEADRFDRVTAFNSLQYAQDVEGAVEELARVVRPDGLVAVGNWGDPSRCETEVLFQALRALAPLPPGSPAPLALSGAGQLEAYLAGAGLEPVGGGEVMITLSYPDLEAAWIGHSSAGPFQRVIDVAGEDAARETLRAVIGPKARPDGSIHDQNVFRYILARPTRS